MALLIILTSFFFRTTWHRPPHPRQKLRRLLRGVRSQWPSSRPAHLSLPLDALATDALGPQWPSRAKVVRGQLRKSFASDRSNAGGSAHPGRLGESRGPLFPVQVHRRRRGGRRCAGEGGRRRRPVMNPKIEPAHRAQSRN